MRMATEVQKPVSAAFRRFTEFTEVTYRISRAPRYSLSVCRTPRGMLIGISAISCYCCGRAQWA